MIRKLWLFLLLLGLAVPGRADEAAIRKAVETFLTDDAKIEAIAKTGVLGLYEVRVMTPRGVEVMYADESGDYVFAGNILDVRSKQDLTEARLRELTFVKVADLPLAQAFKIVRGTGSRQLAYFSDPRCPYCKRLDQALTQVDDVTIHVFLIPIIAQDSAAVSRAVWCAPDRAKAWLDLMLKDVEPPAAKANCSAPLEKNLALGRKYKINSTPTMILADGRRVSGAMPAAQLSKILAEGAKR
jgi:thiol:disulfide interchange protein DsbC